MISNFLFIDVFKFCAQFNETLLRGLNSSFKLFNVNGYWFFDFSQFFSCQLGDINEMLMLFAVSLFDIVEFVNGEEFIDSVKGMAFVVEDTFGA